MYPALALTPGLLRLVVHILMTPHRHETDVDVVPLPHALLAAITGQGQRAANKRGVTGKTLDALFEALSLAPRNRDRVLSAERLAHDRRHGLATRVRLVFSASVQTMAETVRDVPADNRITVRGWVRVNVQGASPPLQGSIEARDAAVAALPDPSHAPDLSQTLQSYLNGHDPRVYQRVVQQIGTEETGLFVRTHYPEVSRRLHVVAALRAVQLQPVPVYATSPRTARISARGRSLASLPRVHRQRLTGRIGWVELDLAHAQLACNAAAWKVESVLARLVDEEYRIWDDLMACLGVDVPALKDRNPELHYSLKSLIKKPVHGVSFGMGIRNVRSLGLLDVRQRRGGRLVVVRDLSAERAAAGILLQQTCGLTLKDAGRRLASHPVLKAMLSARETELRHVEATGGRHDVFGVFHEVKEPTDADASGLSGEMIDLDGGEDDTGEPDEAVLPRQVLARVSQAAELDLLSGVIEDAVREEQKQGRPTYRIVIWQHDGFTVSPKGESVAEQRRVVRRLKRLVRERAQARRIPTRLSVDVGPDDG